MRILSFSSCPLDPMLGSGKTRLRWSAGLRALGHVVEMIEPRDFEPWHGYARARRFRQAWGACGLVKEKLRSGKYDIIEFFGGEFGLATWQVSKLHNRPLIVAHTDGLELLASRRERSYKPPTSMRSRLRARFSEQTHERLSLAAFVYSDAFVSLCDLDRAYVLNLELYRRDRAAVVEPGLDGEFLSLPFMFEKQDRVAYLGTWIPRKGVTTLVTVMTKVLIQQPQTYFDVYGASGQREEVLRSFPVELHQRVIVHPRLTNTELAEGLAKAKVFFFPTQYEGFGMALAEAMACSCAVVTTRTGFGADLRDMREAALFDFDERDAMERSILTLLKDEAQRISIARKGWERVQGLRWETNVKKLESLYSHWSLDYRHGFQNLVRADVEVFQSVERS